MAAAAAAEAAAATIATYSNSKATTAPATTTAATTAIGSFLLEKWLSSKTKPEESPTTHGEQGQSRAGVWAAELLCEGQGATRQATAGSAVHRERIAAEELAKRADNAAIKKVQAKAKREAEKERQAARRQLEQQLAKKR